MVYYLVVQIHKLFVNYVSWFGSGNNCCCKGESNLAEDEADADVEMHIMNMTPEVNNDVFR